jgi:hypothetical protein
MKKILLSFALMLAMVHAQGQAKRKSAQFNNLGTRENPFLQQQWWIGLKAGINATVIDVEKSYSVIVPSNYSSDFSKKNYDRWKPLGMQIGLEATYFFKGFSASIQPTFTTIRFAYDNNYSWSDTETPSNKLDLKYEQEQKISYMYVPVLIKYELHLRGVTPYIQGGYYHAFLLDATKSVTISGTDYASGGTNNFDYEPVSVGAKDLFAKTHYGFIAGAGLYYNTGNIRLNLDLQYRMGQSRINSSENRYQNDRLSGIGDAMDDMTIDNLAITFGTLFPLRFLSTGFKSYDK